MRSTSARARQERTRRSAAARMEDWLPADGVHGPRRRHETRGVDLVAHPFRGYIAAHQRGDLFIGRTRAQKTLDVVLFDREQAIAQLAIGRQADPVAVQAER